MSKSIIGDDGETVRIDTDDRFRLLSAERRRTVLTVLEGRTGPIAVDDLAAAVVREEDSDATASDVAIDLHHRHLPLMDDVGAIDYDADHTVVTACRTTRDLLTW